MHSEVTVRPAQLSVTYLVLALFVYSLLLITFLLLPLLPSILLVVTRLTGGFMEPVYGTAENQIFNIAASFAPIPLSSRSRIIDLRWSRLFTLSEIRDEHMADFVKQSVSGHEQEISEKLLAILVIQIGQRVLPCLRHLINHLMYGQLARTTLGIIYPICLTYLRIH